MSKKAGNANWAISVKFSEIIIYKVNLYNISKMALGRLLTQEGQLMKMRALGYSQKEIADELGISQPAVSQRIDVIRKLSQKNKNEDNAFWELLLGVGALYLLSKVLGEVDE